jgi:hypothetical protein
MKSLRELQTIKKEHFYIWRFGSSHSFLSNEPCPGSEIFHYGYESSNLKSVISDTHPVLDPDRPQTTHYENHFNVLFIPEHKQVKNLILKFV